MISVPLPRSVTVSTPESTTKVSLPAPPVRVSLPIPPVRVSLPPPPLSVSLPAPPLRVSLPLPPVSVLAAPEPTRVTFPELFALVTFQPLVPVAAERFTLKLLALTLAVPLLDVADVAVQAPAMVILAVAPLEIWTASLPSPRSVMTVVPAAFRTKVSFAAAPVRRSLPPLAINTSLPAPPFSVSLPEPPNSMLPVDEAESVLGVVPEPTLRSSVDNGEALSVTLILKPEFVIWDKV